jgi:fatty-acyl-CoA synthase
MFHCNGWNFTWSLANLAGCAYFLRQVRADAIFDLIDRYGQPGPCCVLCCVVCTNKSR